MEDSVGNGTECVGCCDDASRVHANPEACILMCP